MGTPVSPALSFVGRHIGPSADDQQRMLQELGVPSLEALAAEVVPADLLLDAATATAGLPEPCSEAESLAELAQIAAGNQADWNLQVTKTLRLSEELVR
jgi:glycine dehydrogenase